MSKRPTVPDDFEPDELLIAIATRIRQERRRRKMTQVDLAAKSGTNQSTISAAEVGNADIRIGTMVKIAQAMDLSVTDLLPGHARSASGLERSAKAIADLAAAVATAKKEILEIEARVSQLQVLADDSERGGDDANSGEESAR